MKTFFNVLFRRILYKIPLKFLLILLAIIGLFVASANAEDIDIYDGYQTSTIVSNTVRNYINNNTDSQTVFCLVNYSSNQVQTISYNGQTFSINGDGGWYCFLYSSYSNTFTVNEDRRAIQVKTYYVYNSCNNNCDYSGYILESSIDSAYCENNNLCPINTGGDFSGDSNWSALYINDVQHIGGPNIYIDIPEEISWDYRYNEDEDFIMSVEGYNVDYDKINGIISTQNYKASSEDFTYIVKNLIPLFIPGLVIILFIYWLFRFIKKIF